MSSLGLTGTPDGGVSNFAGKTETSVFVAEAGVVPVRFVTTEIPNVVPVEIVSSWAIGVVRVRAAAEIPNVVPIRDVGTGETPRVKIVFV